MQASFLWHRLTDLKVGVASLKARKKRGFILAYQHFQEESEAWVVADKHRKFEELIEFASYDNMNLGFLVFVSFLAQSFI